MFWPCETRTSTCRSFATISSGLYRFLAIAVLLDVKDIPQVGPLQWGWISLKPDSSARADDQDCRHGVMLHGRTRLAHRHVRCAWLHRKTGRGFKRILGISIAPKSDRSHARPRGLARVARLSMQRLREEYAARMTVQKAPAVRISRGVFPVQHLHACVNALTS